MADPTASGQVNWETATFSIPDTEELEPFGRSKPKTYFNVNVNGILYRQLRYSQFVELDAMLRKQPEFKALTFPKIPGKSMFGMSKDALEKRRLGLENYLKGLSEMETVRRSAHFKKWMAMEPDYEEFGAELSEKITDLLQIPQSSWTQTAAKDNITVWTHLVDGSNYVAVRSLVFIPIPVEAVIKYYKDISLWVNWQPDMKQCDTVEDLGNERELIYVCYKMPPVISDRDSSIYYSWNDGSMSNPDEGGRYLKSGSIQHPKIPPVKGYVRCLVHASYTRFEPKEENGTVGCLVNNYLHTDPKGALPSGLVNKMMGKAVDGIKLMRNFMTKKYEDESKEGEAPKKATLL